MADTEVTRKIYKWQERPESCPECDSTCFISSGGMNLTCYHCFLAEGWDTAVVKVAEVRQQTAKAIAQKLQERADQHDNAWIDSNSGSAAQYEMLRMNLATSRALRALADEIEREYEVK